MGVRSFGRNSISRLSESSQIVILAYKRLYNHLNVFYLSDCGDTSFAKCTELHLQPEE